MNESQYGHPYCIQTGWQYGQASFQLSIQKSAVERINQSNVPDAG